MKRYLLLLPLLLLMFFNYVYAIEISSIQAFVEDIGLTAQFYPYATCSDGTYIYTIGETADEGDGDATGRSVLVVKTTLDGNIVAWARYEPYDNSADDDWDDAFDCIVGDGVIWVVGATRSAEGYDSSVLLELNADSLTIVNEYVNNISVGYHDGFVSIYDIGSKFLIGGYYQDSTGLYPTLYVVDYNGAIEQKILLQPVCQNGGTLSNHYYNRVYSLTDGRDGYVYGLVGYVCLGDFDNDGATDDYDYQIAIVRINEQNLLDYNIVAYANTQTPPFTGSDYEYPNGIFVSKSYIYVGSAYTWGRVIVFDKVTFNELNVIEITYNGNSGSVRGFIGDYMQDEVYVVSYYYYSPSYDVLFTKLVGATEVNSFVVDSGIEDIILNPTYNNIKATDTLAVFTTTDYVTYKYKFAVWLIDIQISGITVGITHSPTAVEDLALDPENGIYEINIEYNAVFNKTNVSVVYWRIFDGDTNTTIVEGTDDVNSITFTRTYTTVGDYNTCIYVEGKDDTNNTYTDTACDVVHIDEYPQGLDFTWDIAIPFPSEAITFTGQVTDNGTLTYSWDFGDSSTGSGNPATHSYTSAGTYIVTMTVTDDVGLSKSISKSIPIYSFPDLNWVPIKPHAQEPTTIKVVYDSRLDINTTTWTVPDSVVVDQNRYATTVKFQHYGVKTVDATVTLTDGTNSRDYNLTADINVIPIKWTVILKDEATDNDFNLSTVTSVDVSVLKDANELFRDTYTAVSKTYELNDFPTDISAYVSFSGGSYFRRIKVLNPDYEMNIPLYLVEPTNPLLQIVFIPSSSDVVVTIKRNGRYIHGAIPSIDGTVATYLVRDVAYSVGYVCPDGEEHIIGVYQPITATTVSLQTSCGTVSAYPSDMMKGINFSTYYDENLHSIIVEYSDDTNGTIQACVHITGNGTDYYECATSFPAKFTYIVPQDVNMAVYQVTLTVTHSKYGQFTLSDWVGIGVRFPIPGIPPFVYPWLALIPAIAFILGATALHSRLAPILGILWLAFAVWAEWISLPLGGALISFMLFMLVITWRQEGRP